MKHTLLPLMFVIGFITLALEYSRFRYAILIVAGVAMVTIVHKMGDPFALKPEKPTAPEQPEPYSWTSK